MQVKCLPGYQGRNLVSNPIFWKLRSYSTSQTGSRSPLDAVRAELAQVRSSLPGLVASANPALSEIAQYYFKQPSKLVCPTISLLFSRAMNGLGRGWKQKYDQDEAFPHGAPGIQPASSSSPILSTQVVLAEILELIHTASLIHDDVIDASPTRRGVPSAPAVFGDKVAILGGDWVLGQAWNALPKLHCHQATTTILGVLKDLIEGELMQLKDQTPGSSQQTKAIQRRDVWDRYLKKTYLKTASLVARGAQATVMLGGCEDDEPWQHLAFAYGRDLGIAFQLVDDALDYESASTTLGKPGGVDLQLGLVTAPALFAWEEHPEMEALIARSFAADGDIEKATTLVKNSSALRRTRQLANEYADKAREALARLPESEAQEALRLVVDRVVHRKS